MCSRHRTKLVGAWLLSRELCLLAVESLTELQPIDRRTFQFVKIDFVEWQGEVGDGFLCIHSPRTACGFHPHEVAEATCLEGFVFGEGADGVGQETIHHAFLDGGVLVVALALDGPVVARVGTCHEVDAQVGAPEVFPSRELLPQPHPFQICIAGVGEKQPSELNTMIQYAHNVCARTAWDAERLQGQKYRKKRKAKKVGRSFCKKVDFMRIEEACFDTEGKKKGKRVRRE